MASYASLSFPGHSVTTVPVLSASFPACFYDYPDTTALSRKLGRGYISWLNSPGSMPWLSGRDCPLIAFLVKVTMFLVALSGHGCSAVVVCHG
jgi:hypothetical protein